MAIDIHSSGTEGVVHARIGGAMSIADQRALESVARELVDAGQTLRVRISLEDFEGWTKDDRWGEDFDFMLDYGNRIARIAIVGEPQWADQALMFVGQGLRSTQIRYFDTGDAASADAWLDE
jgi:hypothetical protein